MFKENFIKLCSQKGESPSAVCKSVGITPAAFSQWNSHTVPRKVTLQKIADHFNVSVEYLLGKEEPQKEIVNHSPMGDLNAHELMVLHAYRTHPEMQSAVDKLIGITDERYAIVYRAAFSSNATADQMVTLSREQWEALQSTPDTDDPLI